MLSPCGGARDVSGELPSGEVSSAGEKKEEAVAGDRRGKVSSSYPPIFKAKPGESFREWRRAVDFWLGGEAHQIPAELIGPRLMVQLRERAGQLVHHLTNSDVNGKDGLEVIMKTLEKSPIIRQLDRHKVDQHRKKLMQLKRLPGESIESYVTRGSIYRTQLQALDREMEMGECFYTGHLLDGAKLTRKDKIMVKTRAGSDYEEDVTNAMIELSPELEGETGYPIGSSEPNQAARQGDEHLIQRAGDVARGRAKEAYVVEDFGGGPWDEQSTAGPLAVVDEEPEDEDSIPPELIQAENEAFALQFKARQKVAEVKKLRQYFRRPESAEERKKALQEKMKTSPCHKCGELGHWSRECPNKGHAANATMSRGSGDGEWAALASMCSRPGNALKTRAAYMVLSGCPGSIIDATPPASARWEAMWCYRELSMRVIVDLGCVRSVVGTRMNEVINQWRLNNRWTRVEAEEETFQFGNGETLVSKYRVQLEIAVAGRQAFLAMSVVSGNCPPLMSRHACTQLGMIIDCSRHSFSSRSLGLKDYGFARASNGHYLLRIDDFGSLKHEVEVPEDFQMPVGVEAHVISPRAAEQLEQRQAPHERGAVPSGEPGGLQAMRGEGPLHEGVWSAAGRGPRDGHRPGDGGVGTQEGGLPEAGSSQQGGTSGEPAAEHPAAEYGIGRMVYGVRAHGRGETDDCEEAGEGDQDQGEAGGEQGPDREPGGLSEPIPHVLRGGGHQHDVRPGFEDASVPMEEDALAAPGEEGGRGDAPGEVEAQPALAGEPAGARGGMALGTLRSHEAAAERSGGLAPALSNPLQRGETQAIRRGTRLALDAANAVLKTSKAEGRYLVLEIYAGSGNLTKVARHYYSETWAAGPPVDILYGHDPTKKQTQREVREMVENLEPDLVTLSMPCTPWCSWMWLNHDIDAVEMLRAADLPLWRFAREIWDLQTAAGRLVLTENPIASEGLKLTFMEERPQLHRAKVAQCQFGLKDVQNGKPHKKTTAFDVNDPVFAAHLREGGTCNHQPEEHQRLEGKVLWKEKWWSRTTLAAIWPEELCRHILKAARRTLRVGWQQVHCALHAEGGDGWEVTAARRGRGARRGHSATTGRTWRRRAVWVYHLRGRGADGAASCKAGNCPPARDHGSSKQ